MRKTTLLLAAVVTAIGLTAHAKKNTASRKSDRMETRYDANFTAVWNVLGPAVAAGLTSAQLEALATLTSTQIKTVITAKNGVAGQTLNSQVAQPTNYPVSGGGSGAGLPQLTSCVNDLIGELVSSNVVF